MTTKRPWTEGGVQVFEFAGAWLVAKAETDGDVIAKFKSEADARLFAAADGMYEVLEASLEAVRAFQMICTMQGVTGVADDMDKLGDRISAALRAANPEAFTDNNTVQASEPDGEKK